MNRVNSRNDFGSWWQRHKHCHGYYYYYYYYIPIGVCTGVRELCDLVRRVCSQSVRSRSTCRDSGLRAWPISACCNRVDLLFVGVSLVHRRHIWNMLSWSDPIHLIRQTDRATLHWPRRNIYSTTFCSPSRGYMKYLEVRVCGYGWG